jgi:hypothetical protein
MKVSEVLMTVLLLLMLLVLHFLLMLHSSCLKR